MVAQKRPKKKMVDVSFDIFERLPTQNAINQGSQLS